MVNKRVWNAVLGCNLKNDRTITAPFQGKPLNITAEVEWLYDDWQDLLELTPKTDVLFIIRDRHAKVGSQETPGVTGQNEYKINQGKG